VGSTHVWWVWLRHPQPNQFTKPVQLCVQCM